MGSELIRYNVINKFVGDKKITWEYQADENGQWLEADGALTRIAALQSQLNEAKAGWDSAIADLYAAAEIAKGMQSQLDAKWISVETAMPEYDTDIVLWAQGWPQVYVGYWRHSHDWIGRQRGESDGPLPDTNPTHWQPLPPPPSGAKGETKP